MKSIPSMAVALLATAASVHTIAGEYKIIADLKPGELAGTEARLVNFDDNSQLGKSSLSQEGQIIFSGSIDQPVMASIIVNGSQYATFVLEPGQIAMDSARPVARGTVLNDRLAGYIAAVDSLRLAYSSVPPEPAGDPLRQELLDKYRSLTDEAMDENLDNPLGYYFLLVKSSSMDLGSLQAALERNPSLKQYKRINQLLTYLQKIDRTSPGHKFVDFEVPYQGRIQRLSDYVGRGKYVLVDFWASWCGPCMRQAEVLKQIYEEYSSQGLEILGVAVSDEPENTLQAIKSHALPWPQIINAQNIPGDLYGITAIPCIILFSPDGTILSRDKQNDALRQEVRKAMSGGM